MSKKASSSKKSTPDKTKIAIDLFCGSGSFGKVARALGYEVISVDNRRRKNTCEPTLKMDISECAAHFFLSMSPVVLWSGLPCTIWSNASGGFHLDSNFNPKTELAKKHLVLLYHMFDIIEQSKPKYWFIENPRGRLHKYPGLLSWVEKMNAKIYEVTLSSYGFPTKKPTIIITNCLDLSLLPLDSWGRGAKNECENTFNNMTTVQRQSTPVLLIKDILQQIPGL